MNTDQSRDLAERMMNTVDIFIRAYEATKSAQAHYVGLGGAAALDMYYTSGASPTGVNKADLIAAITSLGSIISFVDTNNHDDKLYTAKTLGSSQRF